MFQFSSVAQLCPTLCDPMNRSTPGSLSITNSRSPPKPMSTESVMPSNHLIPCCPLLLPSVFPNLRVFSNELALHIRWPKYYFQHRPSTEYSRLISFRIEWFNLLMSIKMRCDVHALNNSNKWKKQNWGAYKCLVDFLGFWGVVVNMVEKIMIKFFQPYMKWSEVKLLSHVQLFANPWTVAYQDPQSMGFSRQEYWSGLLFPSPIMPYMSRIQITC